MNAPPTFCEVFSTFTVADRDLITAEIEVLDCSSRRSISRNPALYIRV